MPKRVLTGTVVSDKADKTVVVRVERRVKHPLYGKIIRLSKKYHAHDQDNSYRSGEQVRIEECAPISKLKTWSVIDRIGEAKAAPVEIVEGATDEAEAAATAAIKAREAKAPKKAPEPKVAEKVTAEPEATEVETVEADAPAPAETAEVEEAAPAEAKETKAPKKPPAKAPKAPAKKAPAKKAPAKKAKAEDIAAADVGKPPKGKKGTS
jgi:small subunit ribosomal protein S17